jgi:dTDP-4-dehydrorhamnose reductase
LIAGIHQIYALRTLLLQAVLNETYKVPVKSLLIIGGTSYLGRHLVPLAVSKDRWRLCHTYFQSDSKNKANAEYLDLVDKNAVKSLLERFCPQVIIHTVGSERAGLSLALEATKTLVELCQSMKIRMILVSSDVVFDGQKGHYCETDKTQPLHDYGRMKVETENLVRTLDDFVIVRTSLIYGLKEIDHGHRWMRSALTKGQQITLFSDQLRNPVWVMTLSQALLELASHDYRGALHVAGQQTLSREQFSRRLLKHWRLLDKKLIKTGSSDPKRWPRDLSFDLRRAKQVLKCPLPGVDEVLNNQ